MRRHIQDIGVRKFFGEDLIELQGEGFKILDAFFGQYGNAILEGVEITATEGGLFNLSKGIVGLSVIDPKTGLGTIKIMPFAGATDIVLPAYLTAVVEPITRVYGDNKVKPIAYNYKAEVRGVAPETPYIEVAETETVRFVDIILAFANNYTDASKDDTLNNVEIKDAAVLRSAKEHTKETELSVLDKVALADEDYYNRAKAFAQDLVSRLVDSSPEALNTLQELAAAMGNDKDFAATMINALAQKLSIEGGELTGGLSLPTLNVSGGISEHGKPLNKRYSGGGRISFSPSNAGWYRIARFSSSECAGICSVSNLYRNYPPTPVVFSFCGSHQGNLTTQGVMTKLGGKGYLIPKARLVASSSQCYLEIYYARNEPADIYVNVSCGQPTMIAGTAGSVAGAETIEVAF